MARLPIDSVARPLAHLDVMRQFADFETAAEGRRRDRARSVYMLASAVTLGALLGRHALKLARRMARELADDSHPTSLASARHYRDLRRRVIGVIWAFVLAVGYQRFHAFTVIPRTWLLTPEELWATDPRELMAAFRADLYRVFRHKRTGRVLYPTAATASGYIIAFLHGEYDARTGLYQVHVHGIACDEMIEVVDRLRHRPNYRFERTVDDEGHLREWRRVRIERTPIDDGPGWHGYMTKSFWPGRLTYVKDGVVRRQRQRTPIPEPYNSLYLLWLSRWRLQDLALFVHVYNGKEGLTDR
jgi:hypothetical protein